MVLVELHTARIQRIVLQHIAELKQSSHLVTAQNTHIVWTSAAGLNVFGIVVLGDTYRILCMVLVVAYFKQQLAGQFIATL